MPKVECIKPLSCMRQLHRLLFPSGYPPYLQWRLCEPGVFSRNATRQWYPPLLQKKKRERPDLDAEVYDRKVVKDFLRRDGSLKEIPAQQKKLLAVLRHIVRAFQPERVYSEKHVNLKLARFHADTASLRRYLISYKLMERDADGARYWRPA